MKQLVLADNLTLPLEAVTETFCILAMRGKGKTHAASVMAEEMLKREIPVVIYDPTGAWWGLKSSIDGKSAAFPVAVFGGEHADIPLEHTAGETVARAIVDNRYAAILDCSLMRKGNRVTFMAHFLEALYHHNREAMHLICDEVHTIAPTKLMKGGEGDAARCLGAMEDIILQGRIRGIGSTTISQRPAMVNTTVRTQCSTLIAMGMSGPHDIKAVMEWVQLQASPEQAAEMLKSLPSLPRGDAWFWSPSAFDVFKRIHFRERETFDSSRTPKVGEARRVPRVLAAPDLNKLGKAIQATVDQAKANDPAALKRKIAELEKSLAAKPAAAPPTIKEVPVVSAADVKRVETVTDRIEAEGKLRIAEAEKLAASGRELVDTARQFAAALGKAKEPVRSGAEKYSKPIASSGKQFRAQPAKSTIVSKAPVRASAASSDDVQIGKCERAILGVLSQFPEGCEGGKLALLSGYRWSGGFRNSLSSLRSAGMIEGDNGQTMRITEAGEAVGPFDPLPEGEKLVKYWVNNRHFGQCERKILAALIETPDGMTAEELCAATEYEFSGGFRNALSVLRTAGVIVGKNTGTMKASEELLQAAAT